MNHNYQDLIDKSIVKKGLPLGDTSVAVILMLSNDVHHSGLLIYSDGQKKFIDYTYSSVRWLDDDVNSWPDYKYCKVLDYISEEDVTLYYDYCQLLWEKNRTMPSFDYGFMLTPYAFNQQAEFDPTGNVPPIMTCVGFVLNILNCFLEPMGQRFIDISSYPSVDKSSMDYLRTYGLLEQFDAARAPELAQWIIRVTPTGLFSASHLKNHNRTKAQIDPIEQVVSIAILST